MKLDKRVSYLEAKGGNTVSIKLHLIGVGSGQTREEAKDTYGRNRIGPDDMVIFLIGMSQADEDDPVEDAPGKWRDRSDETR